MVQNKNSMKNAFQMISFKVMWEPVMSSFSKGFLGDLKIKRWILRKIRIVSGFFRKFCQVLTGVENCVYESFQFFTLVEQLSHIAFGMAPHFSRLNNSPKYSSCCVRRQSRLFSAYCTMRYRLSRWTFFVSYVAPWSTATRHGNKLVAT